MSFDVSHRVYEELRWKILKGELVAGTCLRPNKLSKSFNSSAVPIRESLIRLSEQGLVDYRRNSGFWVTELDILEQIEIITLLKNVYRVALKASIFHGDLGQLASQWEDYVTDQFKENDDRPGRTYNILREFNRLFLLPPSRSIANQLIDMGHESRLHAFNQNAGYLEEVEFTIQNSTSLVRAKKFDVVGENIQFLLKKRRAFLLNQIACLTEYK